MGSTTKDYLHLNFLVILWGFTAILGVLITIPTLELVFYRTIISFLGLLIVLKYLKINPTVSWKIWWRMILIGVVFAMHWFLFFGAARLANVAVCLVGLSTMALWTAIMEPLVFKRRVSAYEIALSLLVIVGVYIIFDTGFEHRIGLLMGIGAGFCAAVFTIANAKLVKKEHALVISCWEMFGAWLAILGVSPFYLKGISDSGSFNLTPTSMDWIYILILALVCTVYAYSASIYLLKRLSAFSLNLVSNLEPIYGILLALWILGDSEHMSSRFYLGAGVIVLSVLFYPIAKRKYS